MKKLLHYQEDPDCNGSKHNCLETLSKVMLALDGELNEKDQLKLMEDLNLCAQCLDKFEIEKEFKIFLSQKIEKKSCKESLINNIRSEIHRLSGNA